MTVERLASMLQEMLETGTVSTSIENLDVIGTQPYAFVVRDYVTGREFRVTVADREQPLFADKQPSPHTDH